MIYGKCKECDKEITDTKDLRSIYRNKYCAKCYTKRLLVHREYELCNR